VIGEMEGKTKRGRPTKEWLDDAKGRCNEAAKGVHAEKEGIKQRRMENNR